MDLKNLSEPTEDDVRVYIQGRCNVESLATIARWMRDKGLMPSSRSHLVHSAMEFMAEILKDNGVPPVTSRADAFNILGSMGITWPTGSKSHEQLIKGMRLEMTEEENLAKAAQEALLRLSDAKDPSDTFESAVPPPDWEDRE
jgi:hypothetical protein